MTHTNDAQTVQTYQTRSVCKPRPRLIFKARLLFEEIRYYTTCIHVLHWRGRVHG